MPYVCLIPFLFLFLVFGLFPIIYCLYVSLQSLNGPNDKSQFVGLANYIFLLTEDKYFWKTMFVTFYFLLMGFILPNLLAIPLALFLNHHSVRGKGLFKVVLFLPYIANAICLAMIVQQLFTTNYGVVNYLLSLAGVDRIEWINDEVNAPLYLSFILVLRYIGFNTILYFVGLQSIPKDMYEAADLDGASPAQKYFSLTLPQMAPMIFFAVTLSVINGMQLFDIPFVLAAGTGGVNQSAFTLAYYTVWLMNKAQRLGRGSAVSWLVSIIIIALTYVNWTITNKLEGKTKAERKLDDARR
jgi:ABC-type sugar transport system permease subunit